MHGKMVSDAGVFARQAQGLAWGEEV
jgi:hypothetical protein